MRLASILIAVFALCAAPARADVFVPADPPDAARSECAASAGDVYAAMTRGVLRVRSGAGEPIEVPGDCARVVAAADGTAAVAGSSLVVRRPGGTFGAPIALGDGSRSVSVAVAPGGWAVGVVDEYGDLVALVVRPDGSVARTVVDRGPSFGDAHVGIDAAGAVTVAWRHFDGRSSALRVARFAAGGTPVSTVLPESMETGITAVAVAPGGRTLVVWAGADGVQAMSDGAVSQLLDGTSRDAAALSVSLADDGTALVGYLRESDELVTVERLDGAWRGPRVLWSASRPESGYGAGGDETEGVRTLLGPGGRAAVAWSASADGEPKVYGALGQAGTWTAPARLSSITRPAYATSLSTDAAGVPRVLWTEPGLGVRGATVAPAPADVTAPAVSARFPARLPRTRDGRLTIAVRVRCSEACDVRLAIPSPQDSSLFDVEEFGSLVRAVPAGSTVTLRLRIGSGPARELVRNPRARRLRLRLLVTDRAGNLVRRAASVRVRVIEKPIRSLTVSPGHDFAMKTAAGNRMVAALVNETIEIAAARRVSESTLRRRFARGRAAIRRAGHAEIRSARVARRIYAAVEVPLTRAGYSPDAVLG